MKALEKRLLEVLEPAGIAAIVRGILPRAEMIRIANASRVSVPGMRNRSVSIEHLSETLADRFVADGSARRTILKALGGALRPHLPTYRKMETDEVRARLAGGERSAGDGELPRLLLHLLSEPREGVGAEEIRAAVIEVGPGTHKPSPQADAPSEDDELRALRREKAELSRRAADLVALVDRLRERDRRFREEIAQRKFDYNNLKLQFTKFKKEREALEKEMRALAARLDQAERKPPSAADLGERIAQNLVETRRLAGAIEKIQTRLPGGREERGAASAPPAISRALEEIRRETQALRKEVGARLDRLIESAAGSAERVSELAKALGERAESERHVMRAGGLERVGVFVDVQNMFYAARGYNSRLDFDVLLQTITRGRRLIRAVAYVVEAKEVDQSGFIALLQQKRYEVRRKDLKVRSDGSFKGDWDMEIALDALEMTPSLDVVVLVTGDGDFTGLVQRLKVLGPRVEVYSFPRNTAKELREAADKFVSIDKRMLIRMPRAAAPETEPTATAGV